MDISSDTLYQIVRILFAISLLGFLFLVIRISMRDLQIPLRTAITPRGARPRAELITVTGEAGSQVPEGIVFEIQGVATIGRAQHCKVILEDTSVSAQHALIRSKDEHWSIEDLGSRNGTLVNGRQINKALDLDCGDSIQLGRVHLRLMC